MRVQIEYGSNGETASGVLPSSIAKAFGIAMIYNSPVCKDEETEKWIDESLANLIDVDSRILFLLDRFKRASHILEMKDVKPWADTTCPVGMLVNEDSKDPMILFLPPSIWKGSWPMKRSIGFTGDSTFDLMDDQGGPIENPVDKSEEEAFQELQARGVDSIEWIRAQARQDPDQLENAQIFKTTDLKSQGHKMLCERLERDGYMFSYEAHTIIPDDRKLFRRIDLIVFHRQACVIVEIDGTQHGEYKQRKDDYDRDRLITRHWQNTVRFTHSEVVNNLERVMAEITDRLHPSAGKAHFI